VIGKKKTPNARQVFYFALLWTVNESEL
jgi:hypothetical protein